MQKTIQYIQIEVQGQPIRVEIHREMRRSVRATIASKCVILRIPLLFTPQQQETGINRMLDWARVELEKSEKLQKRLIGRTYTDGQTLQVGERKYTIRLQESDKKSHTATIRNGEIVIKKTQDTEIGTQKAIRHLLSRCIAKDYLPHITRRVQELNYQYFKRNITSVQLKYNHSNWGSCSSKSNINLSTRLLFAPDDVVDYVIIHELAHLLEMNHSDRFWKIVYDVMPDYEDKEKWLKKHGAECDF